MDEIYLNADINKDPLVYVEKVIFCKWKPQILSGISYDGGSTRFNVFQRRLGVSEKVLSDKLQEMESDGLIERTLYAEVPPRVEYHLTETGAQLLKIMDLLYDWGWHQMKARGIEIDSYSEMWHGYREKDYEFMKSIDKRKDK
jgi:DNA-binding HxlR family transcriptional regulator